MRLAASKSQIGWVGNIVVLTGILWTLGQFVSVITVKVSTKPNDSTAPKIIIEEKEELVDFSKILPSANLLKLALPNEKTRSQYGLSEVLTQLKTTNNHFLNSAKQAIAHMGEGVTPDPCAPVPPPPNLNYPLPLPVPVSSPFGWRVHPISGEPLSFHYGTDLMAPLGMPVFAAFNGKVAIAENLEGFGLTVILDHKNQQTLYAHLSKIFVEPGASVTRGTIIALVGNTGASTGPHLHFELWQLKPDGWDAVDAGKPLSQASSILGQSLVKEVIGNCTEK